MDLSVSNIDEETAMIEEVFPEDDKVPREAAVDCLNGYGADVVGRNLATVGGDDLHTGSCRSTLQQR